MKKKICYLSLLFCLVVLLIGCPESDDDISVWIINKSQQDLFVYIKYSQNDDVCPDSTLSLNKTGKLIEKGKSITRYISYPSCDTIRVFILSQDTIAQYEWTQIRAENNYLVRHDLLIRDLKKSGAKITFQ